MAFEVTIMLPARQRELLQVLTNKVRVLSFGQIARTWPGLESERAVQLLEKSGLVTSFKVMSHPELPLAEPVLRWSPGEKLPNIATASYRLRSRWSAPAKVCRCLIASRASGRMFGGHGGRYPRESEETHDIHLAAVFLRLRAEDPAAAALWVHEEEIKRSRSGRAEKLPDAIIEGQKKAIEFGGAYKKRKLLGFHEYCRAKGLAYEVW